MTQEFDWEPAVLRCRGLVDAYGGDGEAPELADLRAAYVMWHARQSDPGAFALLLCRIEDAERALTASRLAKRES